MSVTAVSNFASLKRGEYLIIRVDGSEALIQDRPSIAKVYKAIGCDCIDTVTLTRKGSEAEIVMMVDDVGMVDGKPVNTKATALYHGVCKPGTLYSIHGDVAIVHDGDFA